MPISHQVQNYQRKYLCYFYKERGPGLLKSLKLQVFRLEVSKLLIVQCICITEHVGEALHYCGDQKLKVNDTCVHV